MPGRHIYIYFTLLPGGTLIYESFGFNRLDAAVATFHQQLYVPVGNSSNFSICCVRNHVWCFALKLVLDRTVVTRRQLIRNCVWCFALKLVFDRTVCHPPTAHFSQAKRTGSMPLGGSTATATSSHQQKPHRELFTPRLAHALVFLQTNPSIRRVIRWG